MSRYHVHARVFVGPLSDPVRNEMQSGESDDRKSMMHLAVELQARGMYVWLYSHDTTRPTVGNQEAPYRCEREWRPGGPPTGTQPLIMRSGWIRNGRSSGA